MATPNTTSAINRLSPLFMFLVFLVVFGLTAWYVLWPAFTQFLPGGELNYQTQLDELAERNTYLTKLERFSALYDSSKVGQVEALNNMLPTGKNTALLFAMHEALAKQQNLTLSALDVVSPDAAGTNAGKNELNVSLKLAGATYSNFKQYMKGLESLIRITEVDSMGFDSHTGTINLNLRTFYQGSGQ